MGERFELIEVLERLQAEGRPYYELLRRESLSVGAYHLPAGEPDRQRPHTEDEVYYVLSGEGAIEIEGERTPVRPGSVIFVEKAVEHRFVDHEEGLTVLVIFAPARGSSG